MVVFVYDYEFFVIGIDLGFVFFGDDYVVFVIGVDGVDEDVVYFGGIVGNIFDEEDLVGCC